MVSPVVNVSPEMRVVLEKAGQKADVDFGYLLNTAMRESSLNPNAKASTSTATGLFQFIDSTWLQVLKEQGPALGYGPVGHYIERSGDGFVVRDPSVRRQILDLRYDPQVSADMAAAFTKANGQALAQRFGRNPSSGELYIAHFLGVNGAEKLFAAAMVQPDAIAANLFPKAAEANPRLFYGEGGQPRSLKTFYQTLVAHHKDGVEAVERTEKVYETPVPLSFLQLYGNIKTEENASDRQGRNLFGTIYSQP